MAKKRRRSPEERDVGLVGAAHGRAWRMMEWYVPFVDELAIMYHGHEDPSDHSDCGPHIFCCPRAADLFLRSFPDATASNAEWQFQDSRVLTSWSESGGPSVFYFFFCDPQDRRVLRFCGVSVPELREVLLKRRALDQYLEVPDRICESE